MTRETRIALLVGLAFIVLFGLVLGQRSLNLQNQSGGGDLKASLPPAGKPTHEMVSPILDERRDNPVTLPSADAGTRVALAPSAPPSPSLTTLAPAPAPSPAASTPTVARSGSSVPAVAAADVREPRITEIVSLTARTPPSAPPPVSPPSVAPAVAPPIVAPVTPVPSAAPPPVPETAGVTYKVKPKDTLWKIAEVAYGQGHGSEFNRIVEANKDKLPAASSLKEGMELVVPAPVVRLADARRAPSRSDLALEELRRRLGGTVVEPTVRPGEAPRVVEVAPAGREGSEDVAVRADRLLGSLDDLRGRGSAARGGSSPSPSGTRDAARAPEASSGKVYVVRAGDSIIDIARRHGLPMKRLISANPGLKDPNRLSIGTEIRIPGA